jgi:DNA polymerase-1
MKKKKEIPLKILVDADMVLFRVCSACEKEIPFENFCVLQSDANEARARFESAMDYFIEKALSLLEYNGTYEVVYCFSDSGRYWRRKILPTYKMNRVGLRKPLAYSLLMDEMLHDNLNNVIQIPWLEADDIIGIEATKMPYNKVVIISGDKDMKQIPRPFYNLISDELIMSDETSSEEWHKYQTLVGDTADNYKGCPTIGDVKANRLLEKGISWEEIGNLFESKDLSVAEMMRQAQVSYILRDGDFKEGKVRLWQNCSTEGHYLLTQQ